MGRDGISVIICCYNSALRLPQTLRHLAQQEVPAELAWEVILVDNASTDHTAAVASREWQQYAPPGVRFEIIPETMPGLSHAREKGIRSSRFTYMIFCDDDNWLDPAYLKTAYAAISTNQAIAALGGQSTAVSDIPLPGWFAGSASNYAVGRQADTAGDVSRRKYLWGSGMVVRKALYQKAFEEFPSLLTGRRADELSSGEDSEMCMRFLLMGYRLYYVDTLLFKHYITAERLTAAYNQRLMEGFIRAHDILKIYAKVIDFENLLFTRKISILIKSAVRLFIKAAMGIKRRSTAEEKENIFLTGGYRFKSIAPDIVRIKALTRRR
ncbi:glycosyltransferase [Mucilaginibacter sp. AW1-7]|uniref:glycosyltransferase n=1 Tax=Mucilaginibacter sp. AW1-7 TaxID=3349874 RepID=UPI003F735A21